MESRLLALSKATENEILHKAILHSLITEVENNDQLQAKIGEVIPFLSSSDRLIRQQAIVVLEFFNSQFHIPIFQQTIAEMATVKLTDSACLETACKIIVQNIKFIEKSKISSILTTLLSVDLRANLYAQRISAYKLFELLISLKPEMEVPSIVDSFKQFCGYEQDPRCLTVIFDFFPKFAAQVVKKLDKRQKNDLFDVLGVFYPITQKQELAHELSKSLVALPDFADDLAALVSIKLRNTLADTRSPVFVSLPILLVHKTSSEQVASVVSHFIKALTAHFESGSQSVDENVANEAVEAITNFVKINEDCHSLISQIAISEWIPEIIHSKNAVAIRAFSIVSWYVDKITHFSKSALIPLATTAQESLENNDHSRLQSILASMIEFLKVQDKLVENDDAPIEKIDKDLELFLNLAITSVSIDNRNLQVTSVVFIREYILHYTMPVNNDLIPSLLNVISFEPFVSQCLNALSHQPQYTELLNTQFMTPFIEAILSKSTFHDIKTCDGVIEFAVKLTTSSKFAGQLFEAMAKAGDYKDLTKSILSLKSLDDKVAKNLFETLLKVENIENLILAIAVRANDSVISEILNVNMTNSDLLSNSKFEELIFSAANPAAIPKNYELKSDTLKLLFSAKFEEFPENFEPHRIAMALRNQFTPSFEASDIPKLLEFENQFDSAIGTVFDKFELIKAKFIYTNEYKQTLWDQWHSRLSSTPEYLLKLCLLCPPDYFVKDIKNAIPMLPSFMKCDMKGSLDLLIFTVMNLSDSTTPIFALQLDAIIAQLLTALDSNDPHVRIDTCRILNLLPLAASIQDLLRHKSEILRKLRKVLDDPKRDIRQIAAQANCLWVKLSDDK
ncbi:hypothetical protein TRFO_15282 [Tritrichomonas foetus]|uniref:MMS19 nucleotide excision repair protein n=1 Tax=Tritrichomonas foetus TaxID=1144522 RepID=A0A1J4KXD5_9EUKA|nr:hypothetical protein TRFO_15282 [Tritrichomonas foetus]|eukprot:OHT14364.1 hypothetical protein TRFO_15282 [Tritrichomonas foetus]